MTEDEWSAAIDAELFAFVYGQTGPRAGLEAAATIAADAADTGSPRLIRRYSETLFNLSGVHRHAGDDDMADQFEAQAIAAMMRAAGKGDSNALEALRTAGRTLCMMADQALQQGGDTILSAVMPAGRA